MLIVVLCNASWCQMAMPLTVAPKLDKVMAAECLSTVRSADQSLLDVVSPLTDLVEKIIDSLDEGRNRTLTSRL